jgi:tetratricopeptide (TPR) repeat protein
MPWIERVTVDWNRWDLTAWWHRPVPEHVLDRFEESQEAFEIRFLEDLLARVGERPDILAHLGYLYTQAGRHRDALVVDRRLVAMRPRDPVAHYNLACSYSNLGRINKGFAALKKALTLGFRDVERIEEDEDLANLRQDPRWAELLSVIHR